MQGLRDHEFVHLLLAGKFENVELIHIFGTNPNVDAGTDEDVHYTGGNIAFPAAAAKAFIKSSAAADTAKAVVLYGLDANFNRQIGYATTNAADGTTEVEVKTAAGVAQTWRRVFDLTAPAITAALAGSLLVGPTGFGSTWLTTPAKSNESCVASYTIPAGYIGFVENVYGSVIGNTVSTAAGICLLTRLVGTTSPIFTCLDMMGVDYGNKTMWGTWGPFVAQTDIKLRAVNAVANNTPVTGGFDLYLYKTSTAGL